MNQKTSTQHLDKDQIIAILRKNKNVLEQQFGVTKIALFGSYARGEATETSDIDLLIESKDNSFDNRCNLKDYLESHLKKPVDLGYFDTLRTFIKQMIEKEILYV